jgi:hypothetical protein
MPAFLSRSYLSRGDLRIFLSNCNGYAQDAVSVLYTIFASDGSQASGFRLPAIKRRTGEYYVPWIADVPNGSYRIEWEIQEDWSSPLIKKTDFFFVVDPSAYPCNQVTPANTPTPGRLDSEAATTNLGICAEIQTLDPSLSRQPHLAHPESNPGLQVSTFSRDARTPRTKKRLAFNESTRFEPETSHIRVTV